MDTGGCYALVDVVHSAQPDAVQGQTFLAESTITARCNLAYIIAIAYIPGAASYVKSEPAAEVDGRKLTWRFDCMEKGQSVIVKTWYKAEKHEDIFSCLAILQALPGDCGPTRVGKPMLKIAKNGPATAQMGDDVAYTIVLSNDGTAPAADVVVTDNVPEGLAHATGQKAVTFNVGTINPGETKNIPVTLKATKRGKWCNVAEANTSNAGKLSAQTCTEVKIKQLDLAITCVGEEFVGKKTTNLVTLSNGGDMPLNNAVVTINAPSGLTIVSSDCGANVTGSQAIWTIPSVAPGQKLACNLVTAATVEGRFCLEGNVNTAEKISQTASCCTMWKGVPKLEIVKNGPKYSMPDQEIVYTVIVKNVGTGTAKNVVVTDNIPDGLTHASGQKTLNFKVNDLAPNASSSPIEVKLRPEGESGNFCNVAVAKGSNTEEVTAQACTEIRSIGMKLVVTCPPRSLLKKPAENKIVLTNPGDVTLTNVSIVARSNSQHMIIRNADGGAQINPDKLTAAWRIPTIEGGKTMEFNVTTLAPKQWGEFCLEVEATCAEELKESVKCCSVWRGIGGILLEVVDSEDSLVAGDKTTFTVSVTNQGTANVNNIKVRSMMDADGELKVLGVSSGGKIEGDNITFPEVKVLAPGAVVKFTIDVEGVKEGDHTLTTHLQYSMEDVTGEEVEKEVSETESTHVY